jgi:hypothetical protein
MQHATRFCPFAHLVKITSLMCYLTDSMEGTYEAVGGAMKSCQLMQFLEVLHPLFGYTKGGVLTPLIQVIVNGNYMLQMLDLLKSSTVCYRSVTAIVDIKY